MSTIQSGPNNSLGSGGLGPEKEHGPKASQLSGRKIAFQMVKNSQGTKLTKSRYMLELLFRPSSVIKKFEISNSSYTDKLEKLKQATSSDDLTTRNIAQNALSQIETCDDQCLLTPAKIAINMQVIDGALKVVNERKEFKFEEKYADHSSKADSMVKNLHCIAENFLSTKDARLSSMKQSARLCFSSDDISLVFINDKLSQFIFKNDKLKNLLMETKKHGSRIDQTAKYLAVIAAAGPGKLQEALDLIKEHIPQERREPLKKNLEQAFFSKLAESVQIIDKMDLACSKKCFLSIYDTFPEHMKESNLGLLVQSLSEASSKDEMKAMLGSKMLSGEEKSALNEFFEYSIYEEVFGKKSSMDLLKGLLERTKGSRFLSEDGKKMLKECIARGDGLLSARVKSYSDHANAIERGASKPSDYVDLLSYTRKAVKGVMHLQSESRLMNSRFIESNKTDASLAKVKALYPALHHYVQMQLKSEALRPKDYENLKSMLEFINETNPIGGELDNFMRHLGLDKNPPKSIQQLDREFKGGWLHTKPSLQEIFSERRGIHTLTRSKITGGEEVHQYSTLPKLFARFNDELLWTAKAFPEDISTLSDPVRILGTRKLL